MGVNKITREELKRKFDSGDKFYLVDVRNKYFYKLEHIKGAINLDLVNIEHAKGMFKNEDEIIVYCTGFDCMSSPQAAVKLVNMGFNKVFDYEGGLEDWNEAGLPTEGSLVSE